MARTVMASRKGTMDTLSYILTKYDLHPHHMPTEIRNMGRDNLPELFHELGFTVGAEIGVLAGEYTDVLCRKNPGVHLYGVDAWKIYMPDYRDYKHQSLLDKARAKAMAKIKPYNVTVIEKFSMDAVKDFADGSLDFVYIDANHEYPFVTMDIIYWSRKVRSGGIVSGHDYYETKSKISRCHVTPAVIGYTRAYKIWPWFVIGTKAMLPGEIRDRSRSWMFVKE